VDAVEGLFGRRVISAGRGVLERARASSRLAGIGSASRSSRRPMVSYQNPQLGLGSTGEGRAPAARTTRGASAVVEGRARGTELERASGNNAAKGRWLLRIGEGSRPGFRAGSDCRAQRADQRPALSKKIREGNSR